MAVTEKAVGTLRELATAEPDQYLYQFAHSLDHLGEAYSAVGRSSDALAAAQEAVAAYRVLARADPSRFRAGLARSLDHLGTRFCALGRLSDALPPFREAVTIRRDLAAAVPDSYRRRLASSLDHMAVTLLVLGRPADALPPAEEAVTIRRDIAADPGSDGAGLARSLRNLTVIHSELGGNPLTELASAWVSMPSWPESESFLTGHGELLTDEGQAALAVLAEVSPGDDNLGRHTNLLAATRRDGVAAAYAKLHAQLAADRIMQVINDWISRAPDWSGSAAYYDEHAAQLSDPMAASQLADACRKAPGNAQLWLHLGLVLLGDQRADGYKSAATGIPDPLRQANTLLNSDDLDLALAWSSLARARDRGPGALLMARVHLARQQPDDAAEALADAASHACEDRANEILAVYDKLLRAQPGQPLRHAEHAMALHRRPPRRRPVCLRPSAHARPGRSIHALQQGGPTVWLRSAR